MIDGPRPLRLFGAHVKRRAHERARLRLSVGCTVEAGADPLGDTEVEHLDDLAIVFAAEENVGGLEIAVDETGCVRSAERPRHLDDD